MVLESFTEEAPLGRDEEGSVGMGPADGSGKGVPDGTRTELSGLRTVRGQNAWTPA